MSHIMCHMSYVTCHVSHVMCHTSCVTCHVSHVFSIIIFLDKVLELVGGGSVINGALTPSSFEMNHYSFTTFY